MSSAGIVFPRVVAVDESGRHGPNLMGGSHFALGSTRLTDVEAEAMLHTAFGDRRSAEWKWAAVKRHRRGLQTLLRDFDSSSVKATAVHNRYFGWTKALDTALYEISIELGCQDPTGRMQATMVNLVDLCWRDVGAHSANFVQAFVSACRSRESSAFQEMMNEALLLSRLATSPVVADLMQEVAKVVPLFPSYFRYRLGAPNPTATGHVARDHIDPHVCALGTICDAWRNEFGDDELPLVLMHDEIGPRDVVDRWSSVVQSLSNAVVVRGRSVERPSIQLADIVAGATELAMRDPHTLSRGDRWTWQLMRDHVSAWLVPDRTIWPDDGSADFLFE